MNHVIQLIFGFGWIAFWGYWIYMAIKTRQPSQNRSSHGIGVRLTIVLVLFVILNHTPSRWSHQIQNHFLQILGLILFTVGVIIAVWARIYLSGSWGFPGYQRDKTELIMTGPYKFIRHPIYTGIITAMIGTAIALALYLLIVCLISASYFIWNAMSEEKYLVNKFPNVYPGYLKKTKMLIPFIF